MTPRGLAVVILAAGAGLRLRPLTMLRPKPLCPVNNISLLDRLLDVTGRVATGPQSLAVNAHHLADQVVEHVDGRAFVNVEEPEPLGTAGALGALRGWLDGRDVLVVNGDTYFAGSAADAVLRLVAEWDGTGSRLLAQSAGRHRADFADDRGRWRYCGAALINGADAAALTAVPSGLYESLWMHQEARGEVELVPVCGTVIDCGRPNDYLAANLHASGGASVIGENAWVRGHLTRSVVWDGAYVGPTERLVHVIRAGDHRHQFTVDP